MAGYGCLRLGLFCWVLLAVPVGPQPASSVPGAHLTTLTPPPQSEASMLSLNLGLNFKFHLRGPAAAWGSPVTETQALSPGPSREPEEEVDSGLRTDPFWELLVGSLSNSPPEWGSAEGSSTPWASSLPLESTSLLSGPTDRPTAPYQPRMGTVTWDTALTATAPPSSAPRLHQSELELKFDMALRAGAAPTLGHRTLPLLPSLRASLAEIAGRLGPFGEPKHPKPNYIPKLCLQSFGFSRVLWHHSVPTPILPGEKASKSKATGRSCFPKPCLNCNSLSSIEEALCSEALLAPGLFQGPAFGEALPGLGLFRTISLGAQTRAGPNGRSEEAPGSPVPPELPSPGAWPAGSSASSGSLCGLSRDSSSMLLCSSPDRPPRCPLVCVLSPPRPSGSSPSFPASGSYQALSPPSRDSPEPAPELQAEEALLQEQFLDACRQIDELSVGSDTIDL
ncbi:hypothetical protein CB1_000757029 [Camelus ferus]|nr:hypothetical protein CB1_000757029 [Camelus ferus]